MSGVFYNEFYIYIPLPVIRTVLLYSDGVGYLLFVYEGASRENNNVLYEIF